MWTSIRASDEQINKIYSKYIKKPVLTLSKNKLCYIIYVKLEI